MGLQSSSTIAVMLYVLCAEQEPEKLGIGECALDPMMLGASTTLLNANHYEIYFKDMPVFRGKVRFL